MEYRTEGSGSDLCHIMEGRLVDQQVLNAQGQIRRIAAHEGTIFYCNPGCYVEFYEPEPKPGYRGPVLFYELITETCPSHFNPQHLTLFEPYKGPALQRKRAGGGQREKPTRSDRPPRRN